MTAKEAAEAEIFGSEGSVRSPPSVIHLPYQPAQPDPPPPNDNQAEPKKPRRFGKRKLADARDAWVHIRCTAVEHAMISAKAEKAGLSAGAYLRTLATGSAGPRAMRRPPIEKAELARVLGELGRLGSNVNQLARVVNTTGNLPARADLASIDAEVQAMRMALMKALGRAG